jgi:hypothetical protein
VRNTTIMDSALKSCWSIVLLVSTRQPHIRSARESETKPLERSLVALPKQPQGTGYGVGKTNTVRHAHPEVRAVQSRLRGQLLQGMQDAGLVGGGFQRRVPQK